MTPPADGGSAAAAPSPCGSAVPSRPLCKASVIICDIEHGQSYSAAAAAAELPRQLHLTLLETASGAVLSLDPPLQRGDVDRANAAAREVSAWLDARCEGSDAVYFVSHNMCSSLDRGILEALLLSGGSRLREIGARVVFADTLRRPTRATPVEASQSAQQAVEDGDEGESEDGDEGMGEDEGGDEDEGDEDEGDRGEARQTGGLGGADAADGASRGMRSEAGSPGLG